jgi:glycosyltransferase involved in cell wall biosynthesis
MLAGVPMILSDIPPHREASENGRFARLFPVEDADALSEEMIRLLKDQNRRREMADRAKEHAEMNFSISAHLRELKRLYESLIK